jgi:hypothetical protein
MKEVSRIAGPEPGRGIRIKIRIKLQLEGDFGTLVQHGFP